MSNYLKELGHKLIKNGYLPVPIPAGKKGCFVQGWSTLRMTAADCDKYPEHGVGLLCGQGDNPLVAIDIDSTNAEIVKAMSDRIYRAAPFCLERVGRAPRVLFVVRASKAGLGKMTSSIFEDANGEKHQLEILGKGNQFVAFHIHPDTNMPYEWPGIYGDPLTSQAHELVVVSEDLLENLCQEFDQMCLDLGMTLKAKGKALVQAGDSEDLDDIKLPDPKLTPARVREYLSYLDPDMEYSKWRDVCFALHLQFLGSEEGFQVFDEWSSEGSKYQGSDETRHQWDACRDFRPGKKVTIGTVIMWAQEAKMAAEKAVRKARLDELMAKIPTCLDTTDLLDLAGRSNLTEKGDRLILGQSIQARFKELSDGASISRAELEKLMRPKYQGHYEMTELGNTHRMVDEYGEGMMFVPQTNHWYQWAGSYWELVSDTQIESLSLKTIEKMSQDAKNIQNKEEREAVQAFASNSQGSRMFENMRKNASRLPKIMVNVDALDADKNLFACGNGVIDLKAGLLLPAAPSQHITKATKVDFVADADCPLWKQTIDEVFEGKEELIAAFQCAVGYSMLGNPTAQVLFIPFGNGANGKSTIFSILRHIFGKHGVTSAADTFVGKSNGNAGGPREDLLRLKGARFVFVTELDEGEELREGFIKSLTGGEAVIARAQHGKHSVEFVPTGAVWMPTNHLPTVKGIDEGIWRRLFPIPFEHTFTAEQRDPDRMQKLQNELSGILNWCLEGVQHYLKANRLLVSPEIEEARAYYKSDMDILGGWIEECCERSPGAFTPVSALFASWRMYGERTNLFYSLSNVNKFSRRLKRYGFKDSREYVDGNRVRGFWGLTLKDFEDLTVK